jgi:hypothetical protein
MAIRMEEGQARDRAGVDTEQGWLPALTEAVSG